MNRAGGLSFGHIVLAANKMLIEVARPGERRLIADGINGRVRERRNKAFKTQLLNDWDAKEFLNTHTSTHGDCGRS